MRADLAIWPIQFTSYGDELPALYTDLETQSNHVIAFLRARGFEEDDISLNLPALEDLKARGNRNAVARYSATQTVTVYSRDVEGVRDAQKALIELGKTGIALSGDRYRSSTQFIFTGLSEIKPEMVEEATRKARVVAEKFAKDSDSKLGKIKNARQGQFSIRNRDSQNPHIKKVRVVNTVQYYLSD